MTCSAKEMRSAKHLNWFDFFFPKSIKTVVIIINMKQTFFFCTFMLSVSQDFSFRNWFSLFKSHLLFLFVLFFALFPPVLYPCLAERWPKFKGLGVDELSLTKSNSTFATHDWPLTCSDTLFVPLFQGRKLKFIQSRYLSERWEFCTKRTFCTRSKKHNMIYHR